jgi:hypothetical protein
VRGRWDPVNAAIRDALSGITVAMIATPRTPGYAPAAAGPVPVLVAE